MRVAVAFILLFSLTMAFTINKERPVTDDEQHNEVTIFRALNITRINVNSWLPSIFHKCLKTNFN